MRKVIVKKGSIPVLLGALFLGMLTAGEAAAQQPAQQPTTTNPDPLVNPATGNVVTPPPTDADILSSGIMLPDSANPFGSIDTIRHSLANNEVVDRNLNKSRTPLAYQYIREDDAIWGKTIWEEIDTHAKMNLPFRYKGNEEGGPTSLIAALLEGIRKGEIKVYSPVDDRFTTAMTMADVSNNLQGKPDTIEVVDPVTNQQTTQVIRNDFNADLIDRYRIKETWVFDKQTSIMYARIIGIAPEKAVIDEATGEVRAYTPLFWLSYPDIRGVLARYDVYNPKNDMMRMSWEDVFEMRFFSSYVIREENAFDRSIKDYVMPGDTSIKAGVRRLLEGQRIKNDIFNWEQDAWSY
ncbi:gliding motility protein GldN [Compostibacter hankyongensis]|uniref:Gliding motility protein GldN n=1 Tax=Compostibacter hankyongensis TaxID=1007089 RepID=A0ABP8FE49_9BACT